MSLRGSYGCSLAWLSRAEAGALTEEQPEDRGTEERLHAWLEEMADLAPMTRSMRLEGALRVLMVARPNADWSRQHRLQNAVNRAARRDYGHRKVGRVLSTAVLLRAGLHHATETADAATTPHEAAKRRRDGAMVAMLALMPMRRRAFSELEIGSSFDITPGGMAVHLSSDMTKNGLPWDAPVPSQVHGVLRRYAEEVRPMFMARGREIAEHDRLWVLEDGMPYSNEQIGVRIGDVTESILGVRIPPHFFRDAAATTLARASPEYAQLIRALLAHSSYGTAERHYIHAGRIEAGRDFAQLMEKLAKAG